MKKYLKFFYTLALLIAGGIFIYNNFYSIQETKDIEYQQALLPISKVISINVEIINNDSLLIQDRKIHKNDGREFLYNSLQDYMGVENTRVNLLLSSKTAVNLGEVSEVFEELTKIESRNIQFARILN